MWPRTISPHAPKRLLGMILTPTTQVVLAESSRLLAPLKLAYEDSVISVILLVLVLGPNVTTFDLRFRRQWLAASTSLAITCILFLAPDVKTHTLPISGTRFGFFFRRKPRSFVVIVVVRLRSQCLRVLCYKTSLKPSIFWDAGSERFLVITDKTYPRSICEAETGKCLW